MKNLLIVMMAILSIGIISCDDNGTENVLMVVNRNCSGTYLAKDDTAEYRVCNPEVLQQYEIGHELLIDFTVDADCPTIGVICHLYYPHDGGVVVDEIKEP